MKKCIFIFLLMFLFIVKIDAANILDTFKIGTKVPNMYIEEYDSSNFHNGAPFVIQRSDGEIVYCINPFKYVNESNYYNGYKTNNKIFNLNEEQLDRINLISYYGYNYSNHTDIKWYGITQFLIWKQMNYTDIYFTDKYYGEKVIKYVEEVNELEKMVNDYYILPSFANKQYEYDPNSNYKIVDSNKVLKNFDILNSNIEVDKVNNELYINTTIDGIYEIKFIKRSPINKEFILYNLEGAQPLVYPGSIKDIRFTLTIEVNSGSITINKLDSENELRLEAKLIGASYGLYNNNELITTIETNKDGIGYINNLPLGKYYVKELTPSIGYNLDKNVYSINITKNNKDIIINSYEAVIKGNLVINKYYGEENSYHYEDGAIFELYDIENNLINVYETNNGIINEIIPYGNYYLIQKKGIEGYKLSDRLNIFINENKEYVYDIYNLREDNIETDERTIDNLKEKYIEVEVPDTYKSDDINISVILIIIGLILVLISKIKTTNC